MYERLISGIKMAHHMCECTAGLSKFTAALTLQEVLQCRGQVTGHFHRLAERYSEQHAVFTEAAEALHA